MANVFLAAALLSGILAVSGCAGLVPGIGALGSAGGGYPSSGGAQARKIPNISPRGLSNLLRRKKAGDPGEWAPP